MQILFGGDKLNYKKRGFSLYDVEDYLRVAGSIANAALDAGEHGYGDFQMFTHGQEPWIK